MRALRIGIAHWHSHWHSQSAPAGSLVASTQTQTQTPVTDDGSGNGAGDLDPPGEQINWQFSGDASAEQQGESTAYQPTGTDIYIRKAEKLC